MSKHSEKFTTLLEASKSRRETKDCTVKAVAAATGCSYSDAHAAMAKTGRKPRKGSHCSNMVTACKSLGFTMERLQRSEYRAKTMRTAPRDARFQHGEYIMATSGHVAAVVDGDVIDWTTGRLHRIQAAYQVRPIAGFAPAVIDRSTIPAGSAMWQSFAKYTKHDQLPLI